MYLGTCSKQKPLYISILDKLNCHNCPQYENPSPFGAKIARDWRGLKAAKKYLFMSQKHAAIWKD